MAKEETPESSMLWKVERDDLEHPTYILGTMHLISKEYFHFPEKLEKLVTNSEQLIMELEGLPDPAAAADLMRLPDSVQLTDYFTEDEMTQLYGFAEVEMKMTKDMFDMTFGRMKPFLLLQLITQKQFEGETESFELTLMSLAKKNKIESVGLETIEQQIGFFDAIPMTDLAGIITSYFENADSLKEQTRMMQQVYRGGNLDSLGRFMVESSPELMEFEDILLTNRNIAWVPQVTDLIFKKPSFIAVGAAHLAGENGLINLLRKEGFTVTPVAF
jgi:uncharacterized protein YbaP (TraB family)